MAAITKNISPGFRHFFLTATTLLLSGCAQHYTVATFADPYGFFSGIWHGFVFPFALIANIISWILSILDIHIFTDIQLIGRPNTGFLFYYIGYFLGLSVWGNL